VTDKLDRYVDPLLSLVKEAIACSPESWNEGRLTIECDGSYMNYALKNEKNEEKAQISGALRQLCEDLYVLMRQSGDWWTVAVIHVFREDDSWSYKVNFTYPKLDEVSPPAVRSGIRPWWKLWQ